MRRLENKDRATAEAIAGSSPITRRSAVRTLLAVAAAPTLIGACARNIVPRRRRFAAYPVLVEPERVIRHVAGLRPFRQTGFRVEAERWGDKTIIHDYGHGGGGVSLSWGTAMMACELAEPSQRQAAVIGCGAVGLATARLLQDRGVAVTIYARDLPPNTTSNIAGAQWAPVSVADSDKRTPQFDAQLIRASRLAFRHFQNLVSPRYGITWRENFMVSERPTTNVPWEAALIPDLLKESVVPADDHSFGSYHVRHFLSMHIEPAIYLAEVLADFQRAGGRVEVREFHDRREIAALDEPLIMNCTGLGAAKLWDDSNLIPVKGQLTVLAPQPEVDYITIGPGGLYMMPRQDGIVLGGTFQRGEWSLEPDPAAAARIFEGHRRFNGQMRHSPAAR